MLDKKNINTAGLLVPAIEKDKQLALLNDIIKLRKANQAAKDLEKQNEVFFKEKKKQQQVVDADADATEDNVVSTNTYK